MKIHSFTPNKIIIQYSIVSAYQDGVYLCKMRIMKMKMRGGFNLKSHRWNFQVIIVNGKFIITYLFQFTSFPINKA
jgi:hypothetical protein